MIELIFTFLTEHLCIFVAEQLQNTSVVGFYDNNHFHFWISFLRRVPLPAKLLLTRCFLFLNTILCKLENPRTRILTTFFFLISEIKALMIVRRSWGAVSFPVHPKGWDVRVQWGQSFYWQHILLYIIVLIVKSYRGCFIVGFVDIEDTHKVILQRQYYIAFTWVVHHLINQNILHVGS